MSRGLTDKVERLGNKLPDPSTLFVIGTAVVVIASAIAMATNWVVVQQIPVVDEAGTLTWKAGTSYQATSLLTRDGIYWLIRNLVPNFMDFPPLGVVLVGMLGIGVAERSGLIAAALKAFMRVVPSALLTPAMIFLGILSSLTLDAGYVVLPPLAAALYRAAGRSPLAGLAAVFAGVAAGFNANFFITGLDPLLAGLATAGAQLIAPDYVVNPACNWWFMMVSTVVMTFTGWAVSAWFVEPMLAAKSAAEGGPVAESATDADAAAIGEKERAGLRFAGIILVIAIAVTWASIQIPGGPLHTYTLTADTGQQVIAEFASAEDGSRVLAPSKEKFSRWVRAIVPLLFLLFLLPGLGYGARAGTIRNDRDVMRMLTETMAAMAPIIVLSFFAAQFIACFKYTGLGRMFALAGGNALSAAELPIPVLLVSFVLLTMLFNLFVGSMSAKYAIFAPVFIPMFMVVGISPELTQAAYRIGDSVTNIITPLNPYMVIILMYMRQLVPKAGMGTLITTMLPYTIGFSIVWLIMLLSWYAIGIPLGPGGGLTYP